MTKKEKIKERKELEKRAAKLAAKYAKSGLWAQASIWYRAAGPFDFPFRATRFRPLVERKTDISVFTAMLKPELVDA